MSRKSALNRISELFSIFSTQVKILNSNDEHSINILAESLLIPILNLVYDLKLMNANYTQGKNFPAIDLYDETKKIAFQITVTKSNQKVYSTLQKFFERKMDQKFNKLFVFILTEKDKKTQAELLNFQKETNKKLRNDFQFSVKEHILDFSTIYQELNRQSDITKIYKLESLLEKEIPNLKNTNPIKVSFSFSDLDISWVEKTISKFCDQRISVFTSSRKLSNKLDQFGGFLNIVDELPISTENLIVLFSQNFLKETNLYLNENSYLKIARRRNNLIVPFAFEKIEIPSSLKNMKLKAFPVNLLNSTDRVYDVFMEQFYKRQNESKILKKYTDFKTILKIHNPEYKEIESNETIGYELYKMEDPIYKIRLYAMYYFGKSQRKDFEEIKKIHPEIYYTYKLSQNVLSSFLEKKGLDENHRLNEMLEKEFDDKTHFLYSINRRIKGNLTKEEELILLSNSRSSHNNLMILIDRPKLVNPLERKKNIENLFNPKSIFFIDEFIWDYCTSKDFRFREEKPFPLSAFVDPFLINSKKEIVPYDHIKKWLDTDNNPILVLKGSGGIGKTTLAKNISNQIYARNPNSKVIFIDAPAIVHIIIREFQNNDFLDLYSLYEADYEQSKPNLNKISRELFRLNVDSGNILLIVDGLDEIISRLWKKFDINDFFKSIYEFTGDIGNGKVLITCRNYFWDITNKQIEDFDVLEILPFDQEKAEQFFEKKYPDTEILVQKGMKLAKSLLGEDNAKEYIPFVLEQVDYILQKSLEGEFRDSAFKSKILKLSIKNDYILEKICNREIVREDQIDVDKQLLIFFQIANQTVHINELMRVWVNTFGSKIAERQVEAFKAHPLLQIEDNILSFRYDFFESYLKSIYLGELLNGNVNLNSNLISIIAENVVYNSIFSKDVCERLTEFNEEKRLHFLTLIDEINNSTTTDVLKKIRKKAVSGLFIIALQKTHQEKHNNKEINTKVLTDLFQEGKFIKNLSIYRLTTSDNEKIIFDFSDLEFYECYFSNYDYFWECTFNENTRFENCSFYNLNNIQNAKTLATKENFIEPISDGSFTFALEESTTYQQDTNERVMDDLSRFLSAFCRRGQVISLPIEKIRKKHIRNMIKTNDLIHVLQGLLLEIKKHHGKDEIHILPKYKEDVMKYYTDGSMSLILDKAFELLLNKV